MDDATVLQFLEAIFYDVSAYCEFRWFDGGRVRSEFHELPVTELPDFPNTANVYFGVCPRSIRKGTADAIKVATTLWLDVDAKHFHSKQHALDRLLAMGYLTPSIIVDTGNGYHAYWLLREPLDIQAARQLCERVRFAVNSKLDKVSDAARIMRLPGTYNQKCQPAYLVKIIRFEPDSRFAPDDFDILPELPKPKPQYRPDELPIPEGQRNSTLASIAGRLRRIGMPQEALESALKAINLARCQPPLPEKEVETIARSIARYDPAEPIEPVDDWRREIILRCSSNLYTLRSQPGRVYKWLEDKRRFVRWDFDAIMQDIDEQAVRLTKKTLTYPTISNLAKQVLLAVNNEIDWCPLPVVAFEDKVLRIDNGGTWKVLRKYSPDLGLCAYLPYTIGEKQDCPEWKRFLDEVMEPEDQLVLQEFVGLALFPMLNPQKMLILVGPGGNGKTALIRMLRVAIGEQFTSAVNIHDAADKNLATLLDVALLNTSEETTFTSAINSRGFKVVSGDAPIIANPKYKPPFTLVPTAKWVCVMNDLPRFDEVSVAMQRRLLFILMERRISRPVPMSILCEMALKERIGILQWALGGAARYVQQGGFTETRSHVETMREWELSNSPVLTFLQSAEMLAGWYSTTELHSQYIEWCRRNAFKPLNLIAFGIMLRRVGLKRRHTKHGSEWYLPAGWD